MKKDHCVVKGECKKCKKEEGELLLFSGDLYCINCLRKLDDELKKLKLYLKSMDSVYHLANPTKE